MTTPIHGLPEWTENQNQPHAPVNAALRGLEVLANIVVAHGYKPEPDDSTDEEEGDVFIVEPTGTGVWSGHDNEIVYYSNGIKFLAPSEGLLAWVIDTQEMLQYSELTSDGPGWYNPAWLPLPDSAGDEEEPYVVGAMYNGAPSASLVVARHVFALAVDFVTDLVGSQGFADTVATADTDFDVQKNGVSVGTVTFGTGSASATFALAGGASFAAGDVLTIVAPASPDSTLADITFSLLGVR